jgi:hypothetical protein
LEEVYGYGIHYPAEFGFTQAPSPDKIQHLEQGYIGPVFNQGADFFRDTPGAADWSRRLLFNGSDRQGHFPDGTCPAGKTKTYGDYETKKTNETPTRLPDY